jgi:crossover junction endodeoxyribonuclease RuvC
MGGQGSDRNCTRTKTTAETMRINIGIDPGLSGAIAVILQDGAIEFHDMPVLELKKKTYLDYHGLAHILSQYAAQGDAAAIEMVGAMPGQGVSSMFKFGQTYGAALATLATLQIPYQTVTPPVWKRAFRLVGCDKDESRSRALEMFPACVEHLRLKKHHGRADALLLAQWRKING